MSQIQRVIKEHVVDPELVTNSTSTFGYIVKYNKFSNTAKVNVFDKKLSQYVAYDEVYVSDNIRGSISKNITSGTAVWIDFIGGNKNMLRISDIRSEGFYSVDCTASDKGQGTLDVRSFFGKIGDMVSRVIR